MGEGHRRLCEGVELCFREIDLAAVWQEVGWGEKSGSHCYNIGEIEVMESVSVRINFFCLYQSFSQVKSLFLFHVKEVVVSNQELMRSCHSYQGSSLLQVFASHPIVINSHPGAN